MTQTLTPTSIRPIKPFGRRVELKTDYGDVLVDIEIKEDSAGNGWIVDEDDGQPCGTWRLRMKRPAPAPVASPRAMKPAAAANMARIMPPGTWFAAVVAVLTIGLVRPCPSCKSRRAMLDRAGWRGVPRLLTTRRFWKPNPGGCRGNSSDD